MMGPEELRDLLALAAKAVGFVDDATTDNRAQGLHLSTGGNFYVVDALGWHEWEPHLDDGDALRLAAALGISISFEHGSPSMSAPPKVVRVAAFAGWSPTAEEEASGDAAAAARMAVLRAAAEMGRRMP